MARFKVVYVAGPYRSATERGLVRNIRRAEALALEVWKAGAVAICPHLNTAHFGGECPDETWLEGDLEILRRCDAIILTDNWHQSSGANEEVTFAEVLGLEIFESISALVVWLARGVTTEQAKES